MVHAGLVVGLMISKNLQKEDTPILARSRIGNRLGHQAARFWRAEAEARNLRKAASWSVIRFHRNPARRESSGIHKGEHSLADSPCPKLAARLQRENRIHPLHRYKCYFSNGYAVLQPPSTSSRNKTPAMWPTRDSYRIIDVLTSLGWVRSRTRGVSWYLPKLGAGRVRTCRRRCRWHIARRE